MGCCICTHRASMWLPFDPLGVRQFANAKEQVSAVLRREIELHRQSLDIQNPRDYIDAFLLEAEPCGSAAATRPSQILSTFSSV